MVALESTIITHGMPYPRNVEVARQVEQDIRDAGAVPATIAVIDGALHIGLTDDQLTALGQAKGVAKLSRADMAVCMATGGTGSTTVAATMIAAHAAGIEVFATGGIGGVHKGAELSFDVSADLQELAQTPVTVVAAGAKGDTRSAQNAGGSGNPSACPSLPSGRTHSPPSGPACPT